MRSGDSVEFSRVTDGVSLGGKKNTGNEFCCGVLKNDQYGPTVGEGIAHNYMVISSSVTLGKKLKWGTGKLFYFNQTNAYRPIFLK